VAQKKTGLESVVYKEFSNFSFYNKKDDLSITKYEDGTYLVDYSSMKKRKANESTQRYINCTIDLNPEEKNATWTYIWVDDEYRGKGWGKEIVKKGEDMFKKMGMETSYVSNNINTGFWTRMGYPSNIKVLSKNAKTKSVYYQAYRLINSLGLKNKKANLTVNNYEEKVFNLGYFYEGSGQSRRNLSFDIKINLRERTAVWNGFYSVRNGKKLVNKCESMLKSLGIKKVYVDTYCTEDNEPWKKTGYSKDEEYRWAKTLQE